MEKWNVGALEKLLSDDRLMNWNTGLRIVL
jgi:hypothetical protein